MRLFDYVNDAGAIGWILVALNILGFSLILWRFFVFKDFKKNLDKEGKLVLETLKNEVGPQNLLAHVELVKDACSRRVHELEFGMNTIKVVASLAPLLGLLGTVMGLYEAFMVISVKGLGNPGDFASGMSYALMTTIIGLVVAIPHFFAHNMLSGILDDIEVKLEKTILPLLKGE
jgi:biopolymer transport protein ExbB